MRSSTVSPTSSPRSSTRRRSKAKTWGQTRKGLTPVSFLGGDALLDGSRLAGVVADEALGRFVRLVVRYLLRRGLHQVRAPAFEGAHDAVVERKLGEPT